ncbi:MAG TPA: enoyl-CoA hydratase-related protein [Solirubrobacteraceae bacterium]|nr:enoyl-CoA hydratase-related protein [Solirubrobacteraceae bacterium]
MSGSRAGDPQTGDPHTSDPHTSDPHTSEPQTVRVARDGGVAWITLNRPRTLNAWNVALGRELAAALREAEGDPAVRALVLTGAGRAFSSGADLREGHDDARDVHDALTDLYHPLILSVRTLPKPVIAAVNGPAVGIGCSLALACDLVVAARSAYLLLAFVNIGLGLDGGASHTLLERAGHARAFEMALLGERVEAERALEWGLINRVVDDERLHEEVAGLAAKLAAGPPGAHAAIKRALNARAYEGFERALELEARLQSERASSADFAEGVAAFAQRRTPRFTGA